MYVCMYVCMYGWMDVHPTKHTYPTCGLVCKSAGGLTRHSKIHKDVPQPVNSNNGKFKCYICERTCMTVAGLKTHMVCVHMVV